MPTGWNQFRGGFASEGESGRSYIGSRPGPGSKLSLRKVRTAKIVKKRNIPNDWGKTRPFWCLNCGRGYASVERVLAHYAEAGHGNETMSVGSRGLTKKQREQAFRLMHR
jgi:hypothetical protein